MNHIARIIFTCLFATSIFAQDTPSFEELDKRIVLDMENGNYEKATPNLEKALKKAEAERGKEDTLVANYAKLLGTVFYSKGAYEAAQKSYTRALDIYKKVLGEQTPHYAEVVDNLGDLAIRMGDYESAEKLLTQGAKIRAAVLGKTHVTYALSLDHLGNYYDRMGDYEKAESTRLEALDVYTQNYGEEHASTAKSLESLGLLYRQLGDYEKAMDLCSKGAAIKARTLGATHPEYANSLNNLANLNMDFGEYKTAENYYLQAIDIDKKHLGTEHPSYATSLEYLSNLYQLMGRYDEAEKLLLESAAIRKKVLGEEHPDYVFSLDNLAKNNIRLGNYEAAEKLSLQSLAIRQKIFGKASPDYYISILNLADLYHELGKYSEAEKLYLEEIAFVKKSKGVMHPEYATSISELALLYYDMGQFEDCEALNLEAIALRKEVLGEQDYSYAISLNNLASVYLQMGKYEQVEPLFLQCIEIFRNLVGELHPNYATLLNNLAFLYMRMDKYEEAEPIFLKSIAITGQVFGKEHPTYIMLEHNLGMLYHNLEQLDKAADLFLKVIKYRAKVLGKAHPEYALSLNNLASIYHKSGNYTASEKLYLEANQVLKNAVGIRHQDYLATLNSLAELYISTQAFDKAEGYLYRAIADNAKEKLETETLDKVLIVLGNKDYFSNKSILETLRSVYNLRQTQYELQKDKKLLKQAYQAMQASMQINETVRHKLSGESDKLRTLGSMSQLVARAIRLGIELTENEQQDYIENSFVYAEQNKSMLLADAVQGQKAKALSDLPDSIAGYETTLQQKKKDLQKAEVEALDEATKNAIRQEQNNLSLEIDAFLKSLKEHYPKYHHLKYENITAKVADVQQQLDDKTMLLEYFVADTVTYLFAIDKQSVELYTIAIRKEKLGLHIKALRRALSNYSFITQKRNDAYQLFTSKATLFYQLLLEKALANKTVRHLNIIADGELGHLPFEVFLTKDASQSGSEYKNLHYLIKDYTVSYDYSATLFVENKQVANKHEQGRTHASFRSGKILACAADYPTEAELEEAKKDSTNVLRTGHLDKLRGDLKKLPSAKAEIQKMSESFQGTFLQGDATNEAYFKANAHEYSIIHLAMHGILHPRVPMLSSLAFTDNQDSLEDNFLQAYEIAHLNLNADLVVLSACETGFGVFEQGEGVISLARSFMYAGVPSLVVSLWQVNDASTAMIMESFYQFLSEGMSKDEALRQAKLEYLDVAEGLASHPAFWSAFIQLGDSRPIFIAPKGGVFWWLLGAGVLLIGVLGLALSKRQRNA